MLNNLYFKLIIGIIIILALFLWLIDALSRLYWQFSYSPLGTFALFLLIILLVIIIGYFVYYIIMIKEGEKNKTTGRRKRVKIPEVKTEVAEANLKAVRKQLQQIEDKVTKKALLSKTREIEANLARGELLVVVFGTGSAGKTSLINALIGKMVGKIGAPMGTTEVGETYTLQLTGIERQILITDTPGILEAGIEGTEREKIARQLATEADLLLFVVDNDLRQSEYIPLINLAEIGKRSLLVFNKIDLYTDEDQEKILGKLKNRVKGFISSLDVVPVTANPQTVKLENAQIIKPEPEIMTLIRRLAAILRAEGEDLIADNILLQSQRLGEQARKLLDNQRRRQAEKIVEKYQWIGAGVIIVTPLPVVDLLATAAVNAQMVVEIGRIYGCELNIERGKELALSLGKTLASLGIVKGAIDLISTALQLNVATIVIGKAIQGITAAYLTRIAGKSFIEYFRHDQDWGDGGITEVVQRQFQLNKRDEFVKKFVQDAINKVVKPLTDNNKIEPVEIEEEYEEEDLEKPLVMKKPVEEDKWEWE
jgi:uncharacterized protein